MQPKRIFLSPSLQEETSHFDYTFPVYSEIHIINDYDSHMFSCHWHNEPEMTLILEGEMDYFMNGKKIPATPGSFLFVNANTLHMARAIPDTNCRYLVIIFDPLILFGRDESQIKRKYTDTVLHNPGIEGIYFNGEEKWQKEIGEHMKSVFTYNTAHPPCYELHVKALLCTIWANLFENQLKSRIQRQFTSPVGISHLKPMLQYIHQCYQRKITLAQIAEAGHISPSACCRAFKRTTRQTPLFYLQTYRVQKSIPLLLSHTMSIAEIAHEVGFSSPSYYAEAFRRHMNSSPTAYRQTH